MLFRPKKFYYNFDLFRSGKSKDKKKKKKRQQSSPSSDSSDEWNSSYDKSDDSSSDDERSKKRKKRKEVGKCMINLNLILYVLLFIIASYALLVVYHIGAPIFILFKAVVLFM